MLSRSIHQLRDHTRLRSINYLPEPLTAAERWKEIKYTRVSSLCVRANSELFFAHDPDGLKAYLLSNEPGKKPTSGGTPFHHTLVAESISLVPGTGQTQGWKSSGRSSGGRNSGGGAVEDTCQAVESDVSGLCRR